MIIGIGNIVFGGTGKTQMVITLGEKMKTDFAVIHSGYGGRFKGKVKLVYDGNNLLSTPDECGEEAILIAKRLKNSVVAVGRKREDVIEFIKEEFGIDNFILDDAIQYRRLKKDLEIMMINSDRPFFIPRDNPGYVNLSDCVIIVDRGRYSPLLKNIKIPRFFARVEPVNLPKIRKVIGFCGIGNPESFRRILIENGYDLCEFYIFRDHHFYKDEEIRFLKNRCRIKNADGIITTEKDIIKIKDDDIFYIKTELKVEDSFFRFLSSSHPEIPI